MFADQKDFPLCTKCYIKKHGQTNYQSISFKSKILAAIVLLLFSPFLLLFFYFLLQSMFNQGISLYEMIADIFIISFIGIVYYVPSATSYYINSLQVKTAIMIIMNQ